MLCALALNTYAGFLGVSETLRMAGRNYGLKGIRFVLFILIPAALPSILAGLKIGWAFAWRTLIAAECIGDGYWFLDRVTNYVRDRQVFGRPIGQNQGVQFPIADAFIEVEAANLMRWKACAMIDAHQNAGAEANMAKYLAAKASWEAANACLQFHGGFGFACEYDVERKFRETRLYQVAPISTNLIYSYVAEHILGLPRSF
mgnify:CR=1 FL=1